MLSNLLKLSTTIQYKEPVPEHPQQSSSQEPQTQNNIPTTPQSNGSSTPVTPLSPITLSTAELDTDLESLKTKVKTKTSKAQNKLNELAQQPEFLSNETFKLQTFKFLPKSISLCNDDSVFKENYTKFCDRNAILKPPHVQESSSAASEEVTSSSSSTTTTTTEVSEGTKVIVTKTTKSTKTAADGTKTVTVRKTIVKQKKITEEDTDKDKLKTQNSLTQQDQATVKRTKFRVNQMSSRDVPVANVAKRYLEQNRLIANAASVNLPKDDCIVKKIHKTSLVNHFQQQTTASHTETANNLKNSMKTRSISVDWDAVNAVENRSMKTINSFLRRTSATNAGSAVKQIQAQIEASIHK